jgi:hypothetical protein
MIFVDFVGPEELFEAVRSVVPPEVAGAMRVPSSQVAVRRVLTEGQGADVELWVELSSEEQLYRYGQAIAQRTSAALKGRVGNANVWVMYRVVPRSHAYLNGEPRGRGVASFE